MSPNDRPEARGPVGALLPLLRLYPWSIPALIVLGIFASLAEGVGIGLFIPLLQSLAHTGPPAQTGNGLVDTLSGLFSGTPPEQRLLVISACILAAIGLKAALTYGHGALFHWLDARISHRLRSGIFEQLLTVSHRFLEHSASGKLFNALANETWRASEALSVLVSLVITTCTITVYALLLLLISWKLSLIAALAMLAISLVVRLITRQVKQLGQRGTEANAVLAERMLEGFGGMSVIRAFGRETHEQARFDRASRRVSRLFMKMALLGATVGPVYEVLAATLLIAVLLIMLQNPANLPSLLVFIFVLYRLQPRIQAFDGARIRLNTLAAPVEEVLSLLDPTDKPYVRSGDVRFDGLTQHVDFEGVHFRYGDEDAPALRDVSIRIPAGKTTALVGPSGSGKSTLIKLLLRFYDPTDGAIYVDGRPLRDLDLASWRRCIAWVSQDVYLFNTSIRDNIAYGRLEASEEEIVSAAKLADADGFIRRLPQGYDTQVGDRGVRLSGGQKQRIAFARAILRDPDVLILDEATNALDSISENLIQEALAKFSQNRTVIVIAHRLSTVAQADHIVVLENGRVREQGSFERLIERGGLFARLYDLQSRPASGGQVR